MKDNLPCDHCGRFPTKKLEEYLKHDLGDYHTNPPSFGSRADIEVLAGEVGTVLDRSWHSHDDDLGMAVEHVLGGRINRLDIASWNKMMVSRLTNRAIDCGTVPMIVHGAKDFDIFLLSVSSWLRDKLTIAHELGHYYLHSLEGTQPIRLPRFENARLKIEASWFAMTLLMPEEQFREAFKKTSGTMDLCARFDVPGVAIDMRRQSLGLESIGLWSGSYDL